MKFLIDDGRKKRVIDNLSFAQNRQAIAIMDCIGRLIPQEGVDYDVSITFNGENSPSVSLNIDAITDKGELWKNYIMEMIKKYPPVVDFHGDVIPDNKQTI